MNRTRGVFFAVLFSLMLVFTLNGRQATAEPFTLGWTKTYGGTGYDIASALVQTGDGGYAIAGYTEPLGVLGNYDSWLVRTDSSGTMQWNKTYGGTDIDCACALVQTGEGGYALAGYTGSFGAGSGDFWLVKTDANGTMQWNKTYGGIGYDDAYSVVQTVDGGYALAGSTKSYGAGNADFWLVKTDASGVIPEFSSPVILAALLVVTSSAAVLSKRSCARRKVHRAM